VQVWTLPVLARRLGLDAAGTPMPPVALEITSVKHLGGDIVDYPVGAGSRVAGRRIRDLALPDDAVVAMIARGQRVVPPRGSTRIDIGDHVFFVVVPEVRPLVDRLFTQDDDDPADLPLDMEFPISGDTTVADIEEFYGLTVDASSARTLDEVLRMQLGTRLEKGRGVRLGDVKLRVREIVDGRVTQVGMEVVSEDVQP
jgi:cell volume regulation protein A